MNKVHLYGWNWIKKFIPKIPDNFILLDYVQLYLHEFENVDIIGNDQVI